MHARKPVRRPSRPLLSERLEARRLLAVEFFESTGILVVTGTDAADIIQFETQGNADGVTGFRVVESVAGAPLGGTSDAAYDAYIAASVDRTESTFFDVAPVGQPVGEGQVSRVVVLGDTGGDLIIAGRTLTVPLDVQAGAGNDTISGGPRSDTIVGDDGNDSIFGAAGDDIVTGSNGSDFISGGIGTDTTEYRAKTDGVNVTLDNAANDGTPGENDNVRSNVEKIIGGLGDDRLDASGLTAGVSLNGNSGNDTLFGGTGDDTLVGSDGQDSLVAGAGRDVIFAVDAEVDIIPGGENEGSSDNSAAGGPAEDLIVADPDDNLTGAAANELYNDVILDGSAPEAAAGSDSQSATIDLDDGRLSVVGTDGDDVLSVQAYADGTFLAAVRARGGTAIFASFRGDVDEVDAIGLAGLDGDDVLFVGGLDDNARLDGGSGDDTLLGGGGSDTLNGGQSRGFDAEGGPETGGDDFLYGSDGNDTLDPDFGADYVLGGGGDDRVSYADRDAPVIVGLGVLADDGVVNEGDDIASDVEIVIGGNGNDNLSTTSTRDGRFFGGPGDDTLVGNSGNDILRGDSGNDLLVGGFGDDTFLAEDGEADTLDGGAGNDTAIRDNIDEIVDGTIEQ